jgi:hypothetical protein
MEVKTVVNDSSPRRILVRSATHGPTLRAAFLMQMLPLFAGEGIAAL